jgi:hypothetical protein
LLLSLQIVWENRFIDHIGNDCLVSVDGTDFPILEPHPFSHANFSHKFKGPGVRYEVAVCIRTGDIVWTNGPFQPGAWPDIKIFRKDLVHKLIRNERVEADRGYNGDFPEFVKTPTYLQSDPTIEMRAKVAARHETCNQRFKMWGILRNDFRIKGDDLWEKHGIVFDAIAVITQLSFYIYKPLAHVEYDDRESCLRRQP